jgi:hypothetical protein
MPCTGTVLIRYVTLVIFQKLHTTRLEDFAIVIK